MATSRRDFIRAGIGGAAALVLPGRAAAVLADPYAPATIRLGAPVRISGSVQSEGRGIGGVRVTDGLRVVATDGTGRFTMPSDDTREFVYITVPAGYDVPRSDTGTALFHQRITARAGEAEARFTLNRAAQDDNRHAMLFLADIQTEDAQEVQWFHERTIPDVIQTVGQLTVPAAAIAVGDIMFDNLELYPEYERGVQRTGIPFFQVVGNHDLDQAGRTDETSARTFMQRFGPRYYSFDRGVVHYVVMDDVFWHGAGYIGYLDSEQLAWLANDLAHVEPGRTVIVALHIPVLGSRHVREGNRNPGISVSVTNREALYRLLEPYRAHIVCGHTHESDHVLEHSVHEHTIGTVCGAWWSGPICADGTPCGYALFEVYGDDVRWRYKSTGFAFEHQIRTYAPGADSQHPGAIIANVWDWDPDWRVVLYADGEARGAMAQRISQDPLSRELHMGPDLPARRKWVDPYPVRHLFQADAPADARRLHVEATDRFGRRYTAEVPQVVRS